MDMYAPITITSRVELFTRKNSDLLNRTLKNLVMPLVHSSQTESRVSTQTGLEDFAANGNGYHTDTSVKIKHGLNGVKNGKRIRALHIEDDEEIRFLVKTFLKNHVEVDSAADGDEAIAYTSKKKYDLIITDINLGCGIDGIEATREIRNMAHYQNIPIIAATANAGSDIRNQCIEVGMDAFLLKPFMKNDLISTIEQVISIKQ